MSSHFPISSSISNFQHICCSGVHTVHQVITGSKCILPTKLNKKNREIQPQQRHIQRFQCTYPAGSQDFVGDGASSAIVILSPPCASAIAVFSHPCASTVFIFSNPSAFSISDSPPRASIGWPQPLDSSPRAPFGWPQASAWVGFWANLNIGFRVRVR